METTVLNVEGMSCGHCVKSVTNAVSALDGVESVDVSLEAKTVTVVHNDSIAVDKIKKEIEETGYDVV